MGLDLRIHLRAQQRTLLVTSAGAGFPGPAMLPGQLQKQLPSPPTKARGLAGASQRPALLCSRILKPPILQTCHWTPGQVACRLRPLAGLAGPDSLGLLDDMAEPPGAWAQESLDAGLVSGFLSMLAPEQHTAMLLPDSDHDQPASALTHPPGSVMPCPAHLQMPSPSAQPTHTSQAGQGVHPSAPGLPTSRLHSQGYQDLSLASSINGTLGPPVLTHPSFNAWAGYLPERLPVHALAPPAELLPCASIRPMVSAQPPSRKRPSSELSPAKDAPVPVEFQCQEYLSP